jgi:hypothetical protein
MTNPRKNAKLCIRLAEQGRSLAPHTPKRHSDRIALWRCICFEALGERQPLYFTNRDQWYAMDGTTIILASFDQPEKFYGCETPYPMRVYKASALARLRILAYFAPILDPIEEGGFLRMLARDF